MRPIKPYFLLMTVLIVVLCLFFIERDKHLLTPTSPTYLETGWFHEGNSISLPTKVAANSNETFTINYEMDERFHDQQTLLIRTSLQNIRVFVDDELIYERHFGSEPFDPYASLWHMVDVNNHSEGSILSIEFMSPYQDMAGQLNPIMIGQRDSLYVYLFTTYGIRFFVALLVLITGFFVVLMNTFLAKNKDKGFVYTGIFSVLLSLWMIAESRLLQFFTGSQILLGSLAYIMIPLLPLPLIRYLREDLLTKFKTTLKIMYYAYFSIFISIILLNMFGIYDFFETVAFTQISVLIGMFVGVGLVFFEIKQFNNKRASNFVKVLLLVVFFALIEMISFVNNDFRNTSSYISIGVGILLIVFMSYYIKYILTKIKSAYKEEFYKKLAFMDHITQGYNRLAYERDIEEIFKSVDKKKNLRLVVFDLDELKHINDNFGHNKGDEALQKAFDIMTEVFGDQGTCYRIGGDEFACLCLNNDEAIYQIKKQLIQERIKEEQQNLPYHFGFSIGSSVVHDLSISDDRLMEIADNEMYEHKKKFKMIYR